MSTIIKNIYEHKIIKNTILVQYNKVIIIEISI